MKNEIVKKGSINGLSVDRGKESLNFLEEVRSEIRESYTPQYVKKKLDEFLEAEKVIYNGEGDVVSRQKDWVTQMKGLEKVLELRGVGETDLSRGSKNVAPSKIVIVVNGAAEQGIDVNKVVEAKEIKPE